MIKEILAQVLERRYVWRSVGFDELSELYMSNMMRVFALSILMVFVPYFMYQHGYSVSLIFATFGLLFLSRAIWDICSGFVVARFGPKHTMIASCILQIISAGLFLTIPTHHWPIYILGVPWGASISLFFVAYHTAFSKVKHTNHAGKEIGTMQIMDKLGGVAGPIVGGFAGAIFGARYIFLLAALVMIASLWPLFQTKEPVRTKQVLKFARLPVKKVRRDLISYAALGIENTLCINVWALYVSLFALTGGVYAKLGVLSAAGVATSIASAYLVGRYIDTHNARRLLRSSVVINALLYIFRPFVHSIWPAFAVNIVNETVTTAYRTPYTKGMYAAADDLPGFRIVYISSMECIASITKATASFLLALSATVLTIRGVLLLGFAIAAVASLFVLSENFKALSKSSNITV